MISPNNSYQINVISWQTYFMSCDVRFVQFWSRYLNEHKDNYTLIEWDRENITYALQTALERNMIFEFVQGVKQFLPFLEVRGAYDQAQSYAGKAKKVAIETMDRIELLLAEGKIARIQGRYTEAEEFLTQAVDLAYEIQNQQLLGAILVELGILKWYNGRYESSKLDLQQALEILQVFNDEAQIAVCLTNLGVVSVNQGKFDEGKQYLLAALKLTNKINDPGTKLRALNNLGAIAISHGDYSSGEDYLKAALTLAKSIGYYEKTAGILWNLGALAEEQNAYDQAKLYFQEALDIGEVLELPDYNGPLLVHLGKVAYQQGQWELAQQYCQKGINIIRQINHEWSLSGCLIDWGHLVIQQNLETALAVYTEALEIAQRLGIPVYIADALFGLAKVALKRGDLAAAREKGKSSLSIFQEMNHEYAHQVRDWLKYNFPE